MKRVETTTLSIIAGARQGDNESVFIIKNRDSYECYVFIPNAFKHDTFTIEAIKYYVENVLFPQSSVYVYTDIANVPSEIKQPTMSSLYFPMMIVLDDDIPAGGGEPYTTEEDYEKAIERWVYIRDIQELYRKAIHYALTK